MPGKQTHLFVYGGTREVSVVVSLEAEAARPDADLPEPHPLMPKATARRGTSRMAKEVRAVIGRKLTRARSMELIASGDLDPGRCKVVWNVRDQPVTHPVVEVQVPASGALRPVRRIGTYNGAESRIAMYPVLRGGLVTMLELESQLELHHVTQLSLDPRVTGILAQPFLMVWRHEEGSVVHIPDLAALVDGHLTVYAVKPDARAAEERTALVLDFVAASLHCGRIDFQVLSSMSKQRQTNLARLARYRWPDPGLTTLLDVVAPRRPRTIGGLYWLVREHLGFGHERLLPQPGCPSLIGLDVALYALARGLAAANLDDPINLATSLTWNDAPDA